MKQDTRLDIETTETAVMPEAVEILENEKLEKIAPSKKSREFWLDFMKGILTISMILAHIYQFFTYNPKLFNLNDYINLTTFSAFMFCFGYASFLAYADNPNAEKRMLIGMIKSIIAFYVSSIAYYIFIAKVKDFRFYLNILLFLDAPGYSEFLLSFVLIYVVEIFLFKWILAISESKIKFFLLIAISLIMTEMYRSEASNFPIISALIGGRNNVSFPILQYSVYFLMGLYIAKNKIYFNKFILIFSFIGSSIFIYYRFKYNLLPLRFPPTLYWIIGGMFFVYAYYLLCKLIKKNNFICFFGKNSLFFLVVSNVIIFITCYFRDNLNITNYPLLWLILATLCLGIPTIILLIYNSIKKAILNFKELIK